MSATTVPAGVYVAMVLAILVGAFLHLPPHIRKRTLLPVALALWTFSLVLLGTAKLENRGQIEDGTLARATLGIIEAPLDSIVPGVLASLAGTLVLWRLWFTP